MDKSVKEMNQAFSNPVAQKVATMIATSHEYKTPNTKAGLHFTKNYDWSEGSMKTGNMQGISKPIISEKVAELTKAIGKSGHLEPFVVVNQLDAIRPQTPGKKVLVDGHHRLEACKQLGIEEVPVYIGVYTGGAHKELEELKKTAKDLSPAQIERIFDIAGKVGSGLFIGTGLVGGRLAYKAIRRHQEKKKEQAVMKRSEKVASYTEEIEKIAGLTMKQLKENRVKLTPEERKEVMDRKAVWHMNGGGPSPAVWKSVDPKTGKTLYVTNTHRAAAVRPTLKGAIGKFHNFIKSTASEEDIEMDKVAFHRNEIEKLAEQYSAEESNDLQNYLADLYKRFPANESADLMRVIKTKNRVPRDRLKDRFSGRARENFLSNSKVTSRLAPNVSDGDTHARVKTTHSGLGRINQFLEAENAYTVPISDDPMMNDLSDADAKKRLSEGYKKTISDYQRRQKSALASLISLGLGGTAVGGALGATKLKGKEGILPGLAMGALGGGLAGLGTSVALSRRAAKKYFESLPAGTRSALNSLLQRDADEISQDSSKAHVRKATNYY